MAAILAKSKSGHDKGHVYVVVDMNEEFVFLADGKLRLSDKPKKKNKKHIQPIYQLPAEVKALLEGERVTDLEIKRALKLYMKELA